MSDREPRIPCELAIRPCSLRQARAFVQEHHRHHDMPQGGLWAVALLRRGELVGVAIAGRPVSRMLEREGCCEIIRVCVLPGVPNGCSMLYGRCRRIAQAFGYVRVITYTLESESGASLRASGWQAVARSRGGSWSKPARPRLDHHPLEAKVRWEPCDTDR